jgi:uncharacterized protein (DUF58 family)
VRPLFRLIYRLWRLVSGVRLRAQRRFTPSGLALMASLLLAAVLAPDSDNNLAYQGFTLLFFIVASATAFTALFRIRFSAQRLLPRFGTVGTPLHYTVEVRNLTDGTQTGLSLMDNLADPRPAFEDWLDAQLAEEKQMRPFRLSRGRRSRPFKAAGVKDAPLPPLGARQAVSVGLELLPQRRGLLRFTGLSLTRPDPLGLVRAFSPAALPQSVLILPRRYPLPPLTLPGMMKYQQGGVALASHVGQSDEFVALRDYRRGDPLRHIHWRSWAKAGKPVVREFEDEFFVRHALVLDTFSEHRHSEAFEEAVSVGASFACTIPTQESLLDLLFVGPESYCFTSGRNLAHADQMLEILAAVQPCREKPFGDLERLVVNHVELVSGCICVLLAWDKPRQRLVENLQALGIPVLVLVVVERGQSGHLPLGPMQGEPDRFVVLRPGQIEAGLAQLK